MWEWVDDNLVYFVLAIYFATNIIVLTWYRRDNDIDKKDFGDQVILLFTGALIVAAVNVGYKAVDAWDSISTWYGRKFR